MTGKRPETGDEFVAAAQRWGTIILICIAVWALTGMGYFWPKWVMLGMGIALATTARRVYGGGNR